MEAVRKANVPMWVRHVVVPGLTDSREHLTSLGKYIATLPRVEKVELLPYHTLGVHKYQTLGIPYSVGRGTADGQDSTGTLEPAAQ